MITPYKDSADPKVDQVRRMFNRMLRSTTA